MSQRRMATDQECEAAMKAAHDLVCAFKHLLYTMPLEGPARVAFWAFFMAELHGICAAAVGGRDGANEVFVHMQKIINTSPLGDATH